MKICHCCRNELPDFAIYCTKCGKPLDASASSASSASSTSPVSASVPEIDSKSISEHNPKPIEPISEPIPKTAPQNAARRNSSVSVTFKIPSNWKNILRSALNLIFALVMFISAFFGCMSLSTLNLDDIELPSSMSEFNISSIEISPVDIIEGALARIDPMSEADMLADFNAYMHKHLSDYELEILEKDPTSLRAGRIFQKLLEDYNILLLVSSQTVVEYSPSATLQIWIAAIVAILYIGLATAYLIISVVDFIFAVRGKEKSARGLFRLAAFALAATVGLIYLAKLIFGGNMGTGIRLTLIFSILALLSEFIFKLISKDFKITKKHLIRYISVGISAALIICTLFAVSGSLIKAVCKYTADGTSIIQGRYGSAELAGAWDALEMTEMNKSLIGSFEQYIPMVFSQYNFLSPAAIEAVSPALMGILGRKTIETPLAILGVILFLANAGLIISLVLSLANRIGALVSGKKNSMAYTFISLALLFVTLILTIVYIALVNSTTKGANNISYTASITVPIILASIFLVFEVTQRLIFAWLEKKEAKAS